MSNVGQLGGLVPAGKVLTLPEQIADDLGAAIAKGEFGPGERLLETDIAARYGVSRGPVREAIRALAQRGLAVFYPRRGAFVLEFSLNGIIDIFNTRSALLRLATCYFAAMATPEAVQQLMVSAEELRALGELKDCDPIAFAFATGVVGRVLSRNCGSPSLARILEQQIDNSAWGTLWRQQPLDFTTRERRRAAAGDYLELAQALEAKRGEQAESVMRRIMSNARENAVAALSKIRSEAYDERRLLRV